MAGYVLVGLGNPGSGYAGTRHNVGADLIERLASRLGVALKRGRHHSRRAESPMGMLAVPTTYMNESGRAVAPLMKSRPPTELVVIHDELDLPLGRVRLKEGGGTAGHNGLKSVAASLRSQDFLRLRIGIGRPTDDAIDHVLTRFNPSERTTIDAAIDLGIEGVEILIRDGIDAAQRLLHSS